ncbi:MAG TPA: serine/threonine-protein kinase [Steroidobacteraceae bacterium]|nr:serine/threonine-protein kinase [Steroidobacteraceae bacterium]
MAETAGMSAARWHRIQELFSEARALKAGELHDWLANRCGDDFALQDSILSLLAGVTEGSAAFDRAIATALADVAEDLPPGHLIGRYRILRTLGRGGMGAVYLAERADEQFQQQVAIKLIGGMVPAAALARRFRSERQILANLNHPNIARLLDGGAGEDGVPYLAMEYIDGIRLDRYCDENSLDVRQRLRLFQQVCAAVQYAHQHLVVHRDIKPSNILVTAEGHPKLLDFGIAKLLDAEQTGPVDDLTRVHERIWTPGYASPEQMRGERIGTVSDVYSLGVLLYSLLTGVHPYSLSGRNAAEYLHLVETLDPPRPSAAVDKSSQAARTLARTLAGDLDNIVLRAMHREPERRYPSAAALAEDVQRYLDDRPVEARPDAWTYRIGKFARRNTAALAATSVVLVSIVALVTFYTARLTAERDVAERERAVSASVSQFMREVFRVASPSAARGNSVTVREVLDAAVKRIDTDLHTEPRLRTQLLVSMGQAYNGLGLWDQASQLLERAVAQERQSFGNSHMELAEALTALATANHNANRFDIGLAQYQEALKIREGLGRMHDADAAKLLNAMAGSFRAQQRFDQSLEYSKRAEAIARALDPAQPRVLGEALQGFAMTYLLIGEHARSERLARESLDLLRDAINDNYDLYATSIYALAESLRRQYKLEESAKLQHELLDAQIDRLGADATLVARTWNNISHVMRASGKYQEAQDALLHSIAIYEKDSHENAFDLAVSYHNLGGLQNEARKPAEALPWLQRALEIRQQLHGTRSPQLINTLLEMTAARRALHDLPGAAATFAQAESLARETIPATDKRNANISLEAARLALARKDPAAAVTAARAALARVDGQDDPGRMATIQCVLADALAKTGEVGEARELVTKAIETRRRTMPPEHPMIAEAERQLREL